MPIEDKSAHIIQLFQQDLQSQQIPEEIQEELAIPRELSYNSIGTEV